MTAQIRSPAIIWNASGSITTSSPFPSDQQNLLAIPSHQSDESWCANHAQKGI
jgi:hypothetical protein